MTVDPAIDTEVRADPDGRRAQDADSTFCTKVGTVARVHPVRVTKDGRPVAALILSVGNPRSPPRQADNVRGDRPRRTGPERRRQPDPGRLGDRRRAAPARSALRPRRSSARRATNLCRPRGADPPIWRMGHPTRRGGEPWLKPSTLAGSRPLRPATAPSSTTRSTRRSRPKPFEPTDVLVWADNAARGSE